MGVESRESSSNAMLRKSFLDLIKPGSPAQGMIPPTVDWYFNPNRPDENNPLRSMPSGMSSS